MGDILLGDAEAILRREVDKLRGGSVLDPLVVGWLLPDTQGADAHSLTHGTVAQWHEIRRGYIQRLHGGKRAAIELWPSQLAADKRVIYVTPLRALSAQVERDLSEWLQPLGFSVSSLYGSAGIKSGDAKTLCDGLVVSTPEKLDFALRNDPTLIDGVGLIVLDERHMLGPNEREVRYEALVQRLVRRSDAAERRTVCLSALFPTSEEMSDLVA